MVAEAFAPLSIGADFGDPAATGAATEHGVSVVAARRDKRVLNDVRVLCEALSR
jgi:hypothetical protein